MSKIAQVINKNDIKIDQMKSDEGNEMLLSLVRNCVDLTLKKTARAKIVSRLKRGLIEISRENTEVYDSNVRSQIFYYIDNAFNYVGYDEIDIDELFDI
jgi:hypothetical protein